MECKEKISCVCSHGFHWTNTYRIRRVVPSGLSVPHTPLSLPSRPLGCSHPCLPEELLTRLSLRIDLSAI